VRFALGALGDTDKILSAYTTLDALEGGGKFENLNRLLAAAPATADWTLVVDDDVELPRGFLGRFLACAEDFGLQLAQPAHRHTSHAAWAMTRRQRWTAAHRTRLVEIGPVTAFHSSVATELLPFPALRMGWGLDAHWGGLARERGWRLGVVDATPIRHESRRPATRYDRGAAIAEIAEFLPGKPFVERDAALEVIERRPSLKLRSG
jgi:Glycosyl transferase family 2